MRKLVLSLSITLVALLTACGDVTITAPTLPTIPTTGSNITSPAVVALGEDNQTPTGPTISLSDINTLDTEGRNFYYQVNIPGDAGGDGIWFEIEGANNSDLSGIADIVLVSRDNNGDFQEVRRSTGPGSFGTIASFNSTALETTAIVPVPVEQAVECRGPCIFVPYPANKTAGTSYTALLAVRVISRASINYNLYTYAASYYDETEDINNQCGALGIQSVNPAITVIGTEPDYVGAIEAVNDVDCFTSNDIVNASVTGAEITLPAETTIPVRADFYNGASSTILATCVVTPADRTCSRSIDALELLVKVSAVNGKAAPFLNAKYELRFTQ